MAVEDENSLNWGLHFGMPSLSLSLLMLVAIEKGRLQDEVNLDAKTRPCRLWQLPAGQAFALTLNISRGNHWQWTMMMMVMMIMMMMERVRNWGGKKRNIIIFRWFQKHGWALLVGCSRVKVERAKDWQYWDHNIRISELYLETERIPRNKSLLKGWTWQICQISH